MYEIPTPDHNCFQKILNSCSTELSVLALYQNIYYEVFPGSINGGTMWTRTEMKKVCTKGISLCENQSNKFLSLLFQYNILKALPLGQKL